MGASTRAAVFTVFCLVAGQAWAVTEMVIPAGTPDGFALPTEPSAPNSHLMSVIVSDRGFHDFDEEKDLVPGSSIEVNSYLLHRFSGLPNDIIEAKLEFRIRVIPNGALGLSDQIAIFFDDGTVTGFDDNVWFRFFGDCCPGQFYGTGFVEPGGEWLAPDDETVLVDLAELPLDPAFGGGTLDLIPQLNEHGFLDVMIGDETSTDYMVLRLTLAHDVPLFTVWGGLVTSVGLALSAYTLLKRPQRSNLDKP